MKAIYIAGPYRAPSPWLLEQNVRRAEEMALQVAEAGACPVCPHTMTRFLHGTCDMDFWLRATMEMLRRCDGIILLPKWRLSEGSVGEFQWASRAGIPILDQETNKREVAKWLADGKLWFAGCTHSSADALDQPSGLVPPPSISKKAR